MRYPSLAMDYIRCPSELLDSLKYSSCEEDGPLAVVCKELSVFVAVDALAVEVILVVDEIYLHPCGRDGRDLDYQRTVDIVYDYVHSGEADNLMKLVLPFVDASVARHERTNLLFPFLNALRQISSYFGDCVLRKIRSNLRVDEQDSFD